MAQIAGLSCWGDGYTRELCCLGGPPGNEACWDEVHSYASCCSEAAPLGPEASREERALQMLSSPHAVWQARKLRVYGEAVRQIDEEVELDLFERFSPMAAELKGAAVLCVGARLGGEVKAFSRLGALAIGIDFNPGERNLYVLPGDAHNLQFPDSVFHHVYSNILDHIRDVPAFLSEAYRVLRPQGRLWLDISTLAPRQYEVNDLRGQVPELLRNSSRIGFTQLGEAGHHQNFTQVTLERRT